MTDLDLTPAGLRKLADDREMSRFEWSGKVIKTLRALADQMEAQAAARVSLGEEPSDAAVEAAARELHSISDSGTDWPFLLEWSKNQYRNAARAAFKAANAANAKETAAKYHDDWLDRLTERSGAGHAYEIHTQAVAAIRALDPEKVGG